MFGIAPKLQRLASQRHTRLSHGLSHKNNPWHHGQKQTNKQTTGLTQSLVFLLFLDKATSDILPESTKSTTQHLQLIQSHSLTVQLCSSSPAQPSSHWTLTLPSESKSPHKRGNSLKLLSTKNNFIWARKNQHFHHKYDDNLYWILMNHFLILTMLTTKKSNLAYCSNLPITFSKL